MPVLLSPFIWSLNRVETFLLFYFSILEMQQTVNISSLAAQALLSKQLRAEARGFARKVGGYQRVPTQEKQLASKQKEAAAPRFNLLSVESLRAPLNNVKR